MTKQKLMNNFQYGKIPLIFMVFLILLSSQAIPTVGAQSSSNNNDPQGPYPNFNPSMAIIIVVLVAALFLMGFFSIYIRHCSDPNSGNSIRNTLSMRPRRGNAASRGLEPSVIGTFPMFSYAEVKDHKIGKGALECAVCLNEFEDDETLRLIPKCDHVFHPECIDPWLESHVTCPVCRTNLTPQPGEESFHLPESNDQDNRENFGEPQLQRPDNVAVQVVCEDPPEQQETVRPRVNRNFSFDTSRPPRAGSVRRGKGVFGFGRFRSNSTGHSVVQPGENVDRFTLRLPEEKRKEMLNRAGSYAAHLPRDRSSRRGNRTGGGGGEGSSRGTRSYRRIEPLDRAAQSDRWVFSRTSSFFTRALSIRSPRVTADNNEGSTSQSVKATAKMPSFKCLEPKAAAETGIVPADSARPPV